MVSIKDIAKEAGVSIGTVSNVINNKGNVSQELRRKINEIIDRFDYIPRVSARNLKIKRFNSIGVILPTITDNYYAKIFTGLQNFLISKGFSVNLAVTSDISAVEEKVLFNMVSQGIAGIVLVTCNPEGSYKNIKILRDRNIPLILIDRKINIDYGNFISFDYKKIGSDLCSDFLSHGFKRPLIITGPSDFSCERDFIDGFNRKYSESGKGFNTLSIFQTCLHKFCSFKLISNFLTGIEVDKYPDVIVTTGKAMADGISESLEITGVNRNIDIKVVYLKEQNWLEMIKPDISKTIFRPAYELGKKAAEILFDNIRSIKVYTSKRVTLKIEPIIYDQEQKSFSSKFDNKFPIKKNRTLSLFMLKDLSTKAIKSLINGYDNGNWEFDIKQFDIDDLYEAIISSKNRSETVDIFMVDIPWIPYFADNEYLLDITEYIKHENKNFLDGYVKGLFNPYSKYKNSYYGLPFNFSVQLLFYRKDLFDNPQFQSDFKDIYGIELQVPSTWDEYNAIAEFFTKDFNSESPIEFGNTVGGGTSTVLDYLPRLWAFGGKIFDKNGNITINSYEGRVALKNYVKSFDYALPNSIDHWWWHQIDTFAKGRAAMMIMYVNHTGNIVDRGYSEVVGKFSVAQIPGKIPALGGWSLGINKASQKYEESYRFIRWASCSQIAVPFTVLGGCTPRSMVNRVEELLDLYPYLSLAEKSFHKSRKRTFALDNLSGYGIDEKGFDKVLSMYIEKAVKGQLTCERAIEEISDYLTQKVKSNF